jgi:hypothetical protein
MSTLASSCSALQGTAMQQHPGDDGGVPPHQWSHTEIASPWAERHMGRSNLYESSQRSALKDLLRESQSE